MLKPLTVNAGRSRRVIFSSLLLRVISQAVELCTLQKLQKCTWETMLESVAIVQSKTLAQPARFHHADT